MTHDTRVTVKLEKHTIAMVHEQAAQRQMTVQELCADLIDVALVHLGKYDKTPAAEFVSLQRSPQDDYDCL